MIVRTQPCVVCGFDGIVTVDPQGYRRWLVDGVDILTALPELDADQRELLISGTHAHCWELLWPNEEDDDDEPRR